MSTAQNQPNIPPFLTLEGFAQPLSAVGAPPEHRVEYGFFGREGGVSDQGYSSLNSGLSTGDNRENVMENRRRIAARFGLPLDHLVLIQQTHSADCLTVSASAPPFLPVGSCGDALVTMQKDVILGIQTADCVPVLFYAQHEKTAAPIIGAAHAGWKGALGGVLENTVKAMVDLGAAKDSVEACIGPCIGQASYQVSKGFEAPFIAEDRAAIDFFEPAFAPPPATGTHGDTMDPNNDKQIPLEDKWLFDIGGYAAYRLTRHGAYGGLVGVFKSNRDTCALSSRYFSHRRATLEGRKDDGRQISAIAIR